MSIKKEGFPAVVFGTSLAAVWRSADGFDLEGWVRETIDTTATTAANRTKLAGRLRDYQTMTATLFLDPELDYNSFIDTEDTLTFTLPITNVANTTPSVISDEASIISFTPQFVENDVLTAEVQFVFTGTAFTWTPESA